MPITVGYDATSAVHQSAGIGRYTRQLLEALNALDDGTHYKLFYCARGPSNGGLPELDARFSVRPVPVSDRLANVVWHRARVPLPVQVLIGRFDVFHSPDFTLPPVAGRPTVLTVHDLAFLRTPQCAFPTLRAYLERVVPRSIRRATRVIAVSESTRRDCIDLLGVSPDKISTVHEGVSAVFRPPSDPDADRLHLRTMGIECPYILSTGTLEPRKNYERLLQAFAVLRARGDDRVLVVAGRPGWLYEPIHETVRRLKLTDCVTFVTPNDRDLRRLYGAADAFVYPSLYEGFGIPPLEAMACGAPVICSSTASLPEVVGDAAVTFNPYDVEEIADAMRSVLEDPLVARRLRRQGIERAASFTWERAATGTLDVYHRALHA